MLAGARRIVAAPPDPRVATRAAAVADAGPWTHRTLLVNGVSLHIAEYGAGPLVVLLHGFPECWYMWRGVIPRLAERFHVVAPDLRGYNASDKPPGIAPYAVPHVAADVLALVDALGAERACIVGHDWGGVITWYLGMYHADRISKLAICNAPHPAMYLRALRTPEQLRRSWYAGFFQLPLLPEAMLRLTVRRMLRGSAQAPAVFTDDVLDVYANAVAQPGAATAMVNYYRAAARLPWRRPDYRPVTIPTLVLWGMCDVALSAGLLNGLERWAPDLRIDRFPESSHWLPEEQPREIADRLLAFLA